MSDIAYEKVLNPSQLEAVMTDRGPLLVIAGAGSGKTRTLVYRVARLVEIGVDPENILLLTFTRKAAGEMLERAAGLSDARCRFVSGGTFHSLANRVLRSYADLLGFDRGFTILDRSDMEEAIRSLIQESQMNRGVGRFPKTGTLANILSKAANLGGSLETCMEEEYFQFLPVIDQVDRLRHLYTEFKKNHSMMDYDDLILLLRQLLEQEESVRKELGDRYSHIMVDEYQDTNAIQADIVKWLGLEHQNVMVVGDDSQSIYSFRGANYRNMFEFPSLFPGAKVIKLEENYRSTQPILTFTNALMEQAGEKFTKCLFTRREGGEKPKVVNTRTDPEQARYVSHYIKEEMDRGRPLSDFAVLFRAGYHSFELEVELARLSIPYVKYGGFKFLESAHIKDFLAHLRVIANRNDRVSWGRILRLLKNVGHAKSNAIIRWMKDEGKRPDQLGEWPSAGKGSVGLKALSELLGVLSPKNILPKTAVEKVMEYYTPVLEQKFDDFPRRARELEQLVHMADRYKKIRAFLDDLTLEPPTSSADLEGNLKGERLTLSTIHSAKGLEWPVVFIIWLMEGRFPPARAYQNDEALEEERRLLYVASTRAKDQLVLCYPGQESAPSWQTAGYGLRNGLSSFVQALPTEVLTFESGFRYPGTRTFGRNWNQGATSPQSAGGNHPFRQGDRVKHPAFGMGVVSRFLDSDKVEVFFQSVGRKLLHLEYTTLEKM
ncbi:MAG: ATP-dependent helicase [Deltaproteobacteria bacterium]|nr:MAG: ATP-dependent helicase [Deltaproteobacteria bacterium]